tara:strand:+ start:897 stop:2084 length:1188 start_codon:yes stop_codon:yes gene_type:complete
MGKLKKIQTNQKIIETLVVPWSGDGWTTVSGNNLTFTAAQRDPSNGRAFSNLFSSFNLPTISAQCESYASDWARSGMSALSQENVVVINIGANTYGELIDGRTIKLTLPMGGNYYDGVGSTLNFYSSYYEPEPFSSDNSLNAEYFGNPIIKGNAKGKPGLKSSNVAFLFTDDILGPQLSATSTSITSWSSGWQQNVIPNGYTDGGVDNFRFTDVVSTSNTPKAYAQSQDMPVGICYLDKGFIILTNPTIVNNFLYSGASSGSTDYWYTGEQSAFTQVYFTADTSASTTYYSFEKEILLSINVVADSNEFYITENQTAATSESPYYGAGGTDTGIQFMTPYGQVSNIWDLSEVTSTYITEIGLYDNQNRLLAVAKPDTPIAKCKTCPVTLTLKLKF